MMNTTEPKNSWRPEYPESKDVRVQLQNCEFQTFMSGRKAGINVVDYRVEDPACFWTDYEHVYLRTNWTMWSSISLSSPEQVAAICNAPYCLIIYAMDNVIGECTAPVYHIDALPGNLFNKEPVDDCEGELDDSAKSKSEFQQCIEKIERIVDANTKKVEVFSLVEIGDDCAPLVISSDERAIIMEVLPENMDCFFVPSLDTSPEPLDDWSKCIISLDFVERLRKMQKLLAKQNPDSIINVGFLANATTLNSLLEECALISPDRISEEILNSDFKLFTYDNLGDKLASLFLAE